jgi:hypothetical protein
MAVYQFCHQLKIGIDHVSPQPGRQSWFHDPAEVSLIGSKIAGSSFSGLLTRFEIGQIRIGSDGKLINRSCGSGSGPSQRW